jgi:FtsP/CotA-like multicopper oxidase with cupredoxin domain
MLEVNGRPAKVFGLTGPDGRSGIRLAAGERFHVDLANETGTRTLVHWHGQLPPWTQDGFPWPQTPPITNGAVQPYDYAPIPGTYCMHSHHDMQEQGLMTAPLVVHSAPELRDAAIPSRSSPYRAASVSRYESVCTPAVPRPASSATTDLATTSGAMP